MTSNETVLASPALDDARQPGMLALSDPTKIPSSVPLLMTAGQVAEVLQVSESMVYKLRRSGSLPAVRAGCLLRFHPETVRAYAHGELVRGDRFTGR